jgi:hypothetical protein
MYPWALRWRGPAVLFCLMVAFNWKLVLTNQYTWLENPDIAYQVLPWFQFQAGEWHHGRFPLWDPNIYFGQPLIGQAQPGAAYPLNWLLFLMPLKNGWIGQAVLHWYLVLIRYFAALTAYALARDLGRSRAASVLAGCVYALGCYMGSTLRPQMFNGAVWTPLVFLFLFRAAREKRPVASALASGFFLGFGWLAGHHQMNLFVTIAAALMWVWLSVRHGKPDRRMMTLGVISLGVALLASGLQTIPTAEYGRLAVRWVGAPNDPIAFNDTVPYSVHQQYSLQPISLLGIFLPNVNGRNDTFVGIVAFSFAIAGVLLAWRIPQVRWLAAVGLGGILLTLGPNSLLHGVAYSVIPLVEKARVPAAAILLFGLAAAVLSAYGADLLYSAEHAASSRGMGWILGGTGVFLALFSLVFYVAKPANPLLDDRIMITSAAAVLAAALVAGSVAGSVAGRVAHGTTQRGALAATVLLALFELGNSTNYNLPNRFEAGQNPYLHRSADYADLADYVRQRGQAARVEYDDNEIPFNLGDWYGIETSNGYLASVTSNIWTMDIFSPRSKDFFGIKYYFAKNAPRPELKEVYQGKSGVKVFESVGAYPRVWSVHRVTAVRNRQVLRAAMDNSSFDPLQVALVSDSVPDPGNCSNAGDDVQMPVHSANRLRITAKLSCRGMVILTDTWFPGWRATVDGKTARIYEAYGGVRGVMVDQGSHVIEMKYRPLSVYLGGGMTVFAALITLVAGGLTIRRRLPTCPTSRLGGLA